MTWEEFKEFMFELSRQFPVRHYRWCHDTPHYLHVESKTLVIVQVFKKGRRRISDTVSDGIILKGFRFHEYTSSHLTFGIDIVSQTNQFG